MRNRDQTPTAAGENFRETDWYLATLALAEKAHQHQVDKGGAPYIHHLERVAEGVLRRWPDASRAQIQIAPLHDIIEDGQVGGKEFAAVADDQVLLTVHLLTNPRTMSYLDYVRTIADSGNVDAIRVKLADNEDNSDPTRNHPDAARMLEQNIARPKPFSRPRWRDWKGRCHE